MRNPEIQENISLAGDVALAFVAMRTCENPDESIQKLIKVGCISGIQLCRNLNRDLLQKSEPSFFKGIIKIPISEGKYIVKNRGLPKSYFEKVFEDLRKFFFEVARSGPGEKDKEEIENMTSMFVNDIYNPLQKRQDEIMKELRAQLII